MIARKASLPASISIEMLRRFPPLGFVLFPVYEAVLWRGFWTSLGALRHFRNDRGEALVKRGSERLYLRAGRKSLVRFFAILGFVNVGFAVYNLSFQFFTLRASEWPADIAKRSYFSNGFCGSASEGVTPPDEPRPGTKYACPTPADTWWIP